MTPLDDGARSGLGCWVVSVAPSDYGAVATLYNPRGTIIAFAALRPAQKRPAVIVLAARYRLDEAEVTAMRLAHGDGYNALYEWLDLMARSVLPPDAFEVRR